MRAAVTIVAARLALQRGHPICHVINFCFRRLDWRPPRVLSMLSPRRRDRHGGGLAFDDRSGDASCLALGRDGPFIRPMGL